MNLASPRLWVYFAFVLFFVVLGRKLWSIGTGMLDRRAADIRAELEQAAKLRAEAEAMLIDASSRREAALIEAAELLENARREAIRVAEQAQSDAVAAAKRREAMALDRIAAAEKAAITEVRNQAAITAVQAAEAIIREGLPPSVAADLIRVGADGLPAALSGP